MKYKAIIFDLDGVICHTDSYHYLAWKQLADRLGIHFDETINHRLRGVSRMESLEILLERWYGEPFSQEEKIQLAEEKNGLYKELLMKMSPKELSSDVKETLDCLRERGYLLAIGSSSKNAKLILGQIGLANFFDVLCDGNHIANSKPHPEVFLKAAEYLDLEPKDCLVVEDAIAGIDAAICAGMDSVAVGSAASYDMAKYHLSSFRDILDVV
jgi:beta-phosphoglucomutase